MIFALVPVMQPTINTLITTKSCNIGTNNKDQPQIIQQVALQFAIHQQRPQIIQTSRSENQLFQHFTNKYNYNGHMYKTRRTEEANAKK